MCSRRVNTLWSAPTTVSRSPSTSIVPPSTHVMRHAGTRDTLAPGCRLLAERASASAWDLTYMEVNKLIHVYQLLPFVPEASRECRQTLEFLA